MFVFFGFILEFFGTMLSVVGDVPVDSETDVCGDFVNLVICRLSPSDVLIGVGLRTCVHRGEYACVVSVCVVLCNSKKSTSTCRENHESEQWKSTLFFGFITNH